MGLFKENEVLQSQAEPVYAYDKTQENQMIANAILCFVENAHSVVKPYKKT